MSSTFRILALSAGTRAFLRDVGAWERLDRMAWPG
jgi:hypothetical protein